MLQVLVVTYFSVKKKNRVQNSDEDAKHMGQSEKYILTERNGSGTNSVKDQITVNENV